MIASFRTCFDTRTRRSVMYEHPSPKASIAVPRISSVHSNEVSVTLEFARCRTKGAMVALGSYSPMIRRFGKMAHSVEAGGSESGSIQYCCSQTERTMQPRESTYAACKTQSDVPLCLLEIVLEGINLHAQSQHHPSSMKPRVGSHRVLTRFPAQTSHQRSQTIQFGPDHA